MSRVGNWMSAYWEMMSRSAAWSAFPDMAHEIYGGYGDFGDTDEVNAQEANDSAQAPETIASSLPETEG
ncbi:MAG: hypothetical protein OWT28_09300 [Firmicutes bacterium]|nr:hypothetical protein [Bacillota bacterium]